MARDELLNLRLSLTQHESKPRLRDVPGNRPLHRLTTDTGVPTYHATSVVKCQHVTADFNKYRRRLGHIVKITHSPLPLLRDYFTRQRVRLGTVQGFLTL